MDALDHVLQLLSKVNRSITHDGHVRWHLDAADICVLLELGHELAVDVEQSDCLYQALQQR